MQWYFLSDTQEQVPVQEDQLAGLVQTGVIRSNTMIWQEGMEQWVACSEIKPELFAQRHVVPVVGAAATARQTAALHGQPAATPSYPGAGPAVHGADGQTVRDAAVAFASAAGWMKFLGILFLIGGVAYILMALFMVVTGGSSDGGLLPGLVLGVITATVGGILMWMGMQLFQSATKAQEAAYTAQKHTLLAALYLNAKFFKVWGISVIAVILLYGIAIALFFSVIGAVLGGAAVMKDMGSMQELEALGDQAGAADDSALDGDDGEFGDTDTDDSKVEANGDEMLEASEEESN